MIARVKYAFGLCCVALALACGACLPPGALVAASAARTAICTPSDSTLAIAVRTAIEATNNKSRKHKAAP